MYGKLKTLNRTTLFLITGLVVILVSSLLIFKTFFSKPVVLPEQEVDLPFNADGPYALLLPRVDGNAIILDIKRVAEYDSISYELAYQSKGVGTAEGGGDQPVDRGVTGTLNTHDKKNEYVQEILFGTCSKGNTMDPLHCVFDKGVENGTLLLRIKEKPQPGAKFVRVYKMNTTWHFQKPDVALGKITSADIHFSYVTPALQSDLATLSFTNVNDLTGVPKLPAGKTVRGKVYALNVPTARTMPPGDLTIELSDNPPAEAKIAEYIEKDNSWKELETKTSGSKLTAHTEQQGIFAILINSSK